MGTDSTTDRAEFVQQLYDLAAFIEKRTDLPIPDQCKVQYSAIRGTMAEQRAVVVAAATALAVELIEWDSGDGSRAVSARYRDPSGFEYVVHADTRFGSDYRPEPEPTDVADLPLPPIFTAPTAPPPPVGGPSHPDGPAIPGLDEAPEDWKLTDGETDAILDLLGDDAKLYGYEDPAAVTE